MNKVYKTNTIPKILINNLDLNIKDSIDKNNNSKIINQSDNIIVKTFNNYLQIPKNKKNI